MPWIGSVSGVLESWYPGIAGGEAIADLLFGVVNPSGKLPITFAKDDADLPLPRIPGMGADNKPDTDVTGSGHKGFTMSYPEGLAVGYRWYQVQHRQPLFAFGYGLSYTTFAYSGLTVDRASRMVSFQLANTGHVAGSEIAQLYVTPPPAAGEPFERLAGWQRVELAPGSSRRVTIPLDPAWISVFDASAHAWKLQPGDYTLAIGSASDKTPLHATLHLP
jgi:beta-glucosidase